MDLMEPNITVCIFEDVLAEFYGKEMLQENNRNKLKLALLGMKDIDLVLDPKNHIKQFIDHK